jgi:hypothetical protein
MSPRAPRLLVLVGLGLGGCVVGGGAASTDAGSDAPRDAPIDVPLDAAPGCRVADAAWLPDVSQYVILTTTGRVVRLDADGGAISDRAMSDYPGLVAACGGTAVGCQVDAITWRSPTERIVVVGGALYTLDTAMTTAGAPLALSAIPGAVAGPCAGVVGVCHLDGLVWRDDLQRFIAVAQGNQYTLDVAGALVSTMSLRANPTLAAGPCATQVGACRVDAITYRAPVYHVIAADYLFNLDGTTGASGGMAPLTDFAGLAPLCR